LHGSTIAAPEGNDTCFVAAKRSRLCPVDGFMFGGRSGVAGVPGPPTALLAYPVEVLLLSVEWRRAPIYGVPRL
jgi:hypothetical protein